MEQEKLEALLEQIPNDWATLSLIMNHVGHKYWEAAVKERGPGAVQLLESEDNSVMVFTRGEHREELKEFVRNLNPSQERSVDTTNDSKKDNVLSKVEDLRNTVIPKNINGKQFKKLVD